jgi:flagellar hook-length control protein FliK
MNASALPAPPNAAANAVPSAPQAGAGPAARAAPSAGGAAFGRLLGEARDAGKGPGRHPDGRSDRAGAAEPWSASGAAGPAATEGAPEGPVPSADGRADAPAAAAGKAHPSAGQGAAGTPAHDRRPRPARDGMQGRSAVPADPRAPAGEARHLAGSGGARAAAAPDAAGTLDAGVDAASEATASTDGALQQALPAAGHGAPPLATDPAPEPTVLRPASHGPTAHPEGRAGVDIPGERPGLAPAVAAAETDVEPAAAQPALAPAETGPVQGTTAWTSAAGPHGAHATPSDGARNDAPAAAATSRSESGAQALAPSDIGRGGHGVGIGESGTPQVAPGPPAPAPTGLDGRPAGVPADTLAPPLHSPGFAPALAARVLLMLREGTREARLQLNPAELGPIGVRISVDGSQARVDLVADQAPTRQVLEQALPGLAGALREAGLTLAGGGVFDAPRGAPGDTSRDGRSGPHGGAGAQPGGGAGTGPGTDGAVDGAAPAARAVARGLLDLYA